MGGGLGMVLTFRLPDGSTRETSFADRRPPLGMDFERIAPVRVKRITPGGSAEELGVKPGWVVVAINGEDVEKREFNDVFARMRVAASARPEMPTSFQNSPPG